MHYVYIICIYTNPLKYTQITHILTYTCKHATNFQVTLFVTLSSLCNGASGSAEELAQLKTDMRLAIKQVQMAQMNAEVNNRISFNSGLQKTRQYRDATEVYNIESIAGVRALGMHNHHDHKHTIGLGELLMTLNGVTFRTRHNDFPMRMPHRKSSEYTASEEIPYPPVPPAVLKKTTLAEQIKEMQMWFKAFKDQDYSERDYRKYFKSVLCYLEGTWTVAKDGKIVEPFFSDRHSLAASTFDELHDKVMFNEFTGHKNKDENYAILPTRIMGIDNVTTPNVAQWNYRIMCHPTRKFVRQDRLKAIDDFFLRLRTGQPVDTYESMLKARFQVNREDSNQWVDGEYRYGFLDQLMYEIPGLDNYKAKIQDNAFNQLAMDLPKVKEPLDAGYYHRWYLGQKGAMNENEKHKGFSDPHVFMAMNTQEKVAPVYVESGCKVSKSGDKTCSYETSQRWSYAVPLELIYLTPLGSWNPYNLRYRGDYKTDEGEMVTAGGRNGGDEQTKAFDGMNSQTFFQTPSEFYSAGDIKPASADTVKQASVGILDDKGQVRKVCASGIMIETRDIPGVGSVRLRYPIVPLADDDQTIYKEIKALKDYVMTSAKYARILNETKNYELENTRAPRFNEWSSGTFQMTYAEGNKTHPAHTHTVTLSKYDIEVMRENWPIKLSVLSSKNAGHFHKLMVRFQHFSQKYVWDYCDDQKGPTCSDGHKIQLIRVTTENE